MPRIYWAEIRVILLKATQRGIAYFSSQNILKDTLHLKAKYTSFYTQVDKKQDSYIILTRTSYGTNQYNHKTEEKINVIVRRETFQLTTSDVPLVQSPPSKPHSAVL